MGTERQEAGILARAIAGLAGLGCRFPRLFLCLTLLSCVASLFYTFQHLSYHTSRNDLISQNKDYLQRWRQYVTEFGDDDDMVVVVEGKDQARMRAALEELAGLIADVPEHFDRLFYKADLRHLQNRALLYAPAENIRQIQASLKTMHLLLDPPVLAQLDPLFSWRSLTLAQLVSEGERKTHTLLSAAEPSAEAAAYLRQLDAICASAAASLDDPAAYRNPWRSIIPGSAGDMASLAEPEYFFSKDGTLAFLLVRPIFRESGSFTAEQACIDKLRGLIERVRAKYGDLGIGLTGLPVLENDEMFASQADSQRASWLALLGVALLYLLVYRGLRYPLMTVASLLLGTIWALGWLTLTVGHLNILSSAFAVMLIGMGDYGVLWVARFQQERRAGLVLTKAMRQTALHVGPSILTAALTTSLAFFAAMFADLKAVAELGWIAGCGVLFCALACFLAMPPLLTLFGGRLAFADPGEGQSFRTIIPLEEAKEQNRTWLPGLMARPGWVLAGTLLAVALLGSQALCVQYDHNLLHLQAEHHESVQWEKKLIEHTAGASWSALSYTATREEALALKKKFEELPQVSRVVEVASLVPLDQERKLEQLKDIQERLRRLPERGQVIPHTPPHAEDVARHAVRLKASVRQLAEAQPRSDVGNLLENLDKVISKLPSPSSAEGKGSRRLSPEEASQRLLAFQKRLTSDLAEDLHRLRDVSTPKPIELADVPAPMRERFVSANGRWLMWILAKDCLWDFRPLEEFTAQVSTVDPEATGKPFTTLEGLRAMRNGFLWAGVYALLAMLVVLFLDFGNFRDLLLALAPLAIGIVATVGMMGFLGVPLNPANLIAFPLILGVGADNGVHVVHDYRQRHAGKRYLLHHATGRGILVAALTTILGFGALMLAQHRGLASLGVVLTLGVTCCMLASLVFLPCLLNLLSARARVRPSASPVPFPAASRRRVVMR